MQIASAARELLARDINFLGGVRALIAPGYEPNGYDYAPGIEFLSWFNTVSAHLPGQAIREQCTHAFLERSDAEVVQLEKHHGDRIDQACQALLDRFGKNV